MRTRQDLVNALDDQESLWRDPGGAKCPATGGIVHVDNDHDGNCEALVKIGKEQEERGLIQSGLFDFYHVSTERMAP